MKPRIDKDWYRTHGAMLRGAAVAVVVAVLLAYVGYRWNALGRLAVDDVYTPDNETGFIGRSNELLQRLVDEGNERSPETCRTIADLNKKYPALRFELPYKANEMMGGRAADIRLVDIVMDSIRNEEDRIFFNNSKLGGMLAQQRRSMGDNQFRIRFDGDGRGIKVKSITLIASRFRVALSSDPWRSSVIAADNAMFDRERHCFVSYGGSVVPLRVGGATLPTAGNTQTLYVLNSEHVLSTTSGKVTPVDWLEMDERFAERPLLNLVFRRAGAASYSESLKLGFDGDSLLVRVEGSNGFRCQPFYIGATGDDVVSSSGSNIQSMKRLPLDRGDVKLVVTGADGSRSELTVSRNNPLLVLSQPVHTTRGRGRYNLPPAMTDRFTGQVVRGLNNALRNTTYDSACIRLTLDPLLGKTIEQMLSTYYNERLRTNYPRHTKSGKAFNEIEMSVTVMDMATGNVLAVPYFRSADIDMPLDVVMERKNPALVRRFIGSTFKPLLATAAAVTVPSLSTYVPAAGDFYISDNVPYLYGMPIAQWGPTSHWAAHSPMSAFFSQSEDVYPVALAMRAMCGGEVDRNGSGVFVTRNGSWSMPTDGAEVTNFANNAFFQNITALYNVKSWSATEIGETDDFDMSQYIWRGLHLQDDQTFAMEIVNPDMVNMAYELMCHNNPTLKSHLVPWVLGQGNNEWNAVKLAEAWTRMLTKRAVEASLVASDSVPMPPAIARPGGDGAFDNNAWNNVLGALELAQSSGSLLSGVYNRVQRLNQAEGLDDNHKLVLYGKTGTPDNYTRIEGLQAERTSLVLDPGLYCMALMPRHAVTAAAGGGAGSGGIMIVVRVTRIVPKALEGSSNGIGSADAREFLLHHNNLENIYRLTRQYLQ